MWSATALAIQASLPFASLLMLDDTCRWRDRFAAGYMAALGLIALLSVDPALLAAYAASVGECMECMP